MRDTWRACAREEDPIRRCIGFRVACSALCVLRVCAPVGCARVWGCGPWAVVGWPRDGGRCVSSFDILMFVFVVTD
jgi:hypothetical protein